MHSVQILAGITALLATTTFAHPGLAKARATARAYPAQRDAYPQPVGGSQNQCGKDQTLACCNSKNLSGADRDSLLGAIGLNQLLGGNCEAITVPVFAVPFNSQQACGSNIAACCQQNDQTGAINVNVQCSPIDVL